MAGPVNVHATAIVVATTGIVFVGPSGAGKTRLALA
ncbi:HPr kinase/phosphorylase, partial [Rhizobium sp. TRM95111]|nr:HPr kinase/phosphorylase [Rhizobium alarense]